MAEPVSDMIERLNAALEDRYRIERELGEGGMATVYLADDLKHERRVAIKVLKPELAAVVGAERFLTEIKTTANLQHPHILPLFDSGEAGGFLYFVMPYIEGETLRDRLERERQLPVNEAVGIASAVASALSAAHEAGVVHRDLKPANILLSRGEPLVADFGIALAVTSGGGNRLTETGLSMGTPYYMSPEQATGDQAVGAASDVYALGCVLYEMLVGEPPYMGATAQAVLGKILTETPREPTALRASVPANVGAAVLKALEKLPADRFGSAREFAAALADPGFRHGTAAAVGAGASGPAGPWKRRAYLAAGLAGILAVTSAWLAFGPTGSAPEPVSRYAIELPEGHDVSAHFGANLAIAPDGSAIVYVGPGSDASDRRQLWLRRRDQLVPAPMPGTERAHNPTFSPAGTHVAFRVDGAVRTVSLGGEPPVEILADDAGGFGLAWADDGYVYIGSGRGLARVRETSGALEWILPADEEAGEAGFVWPHALPDGRGILFSVASLPFSNTQTWELAVLDPRSGEHRMLTRGVQAHFARSGHLVYVAADGSLLAAPFDLASLELAGDPTALTGGVGMSFAGTVDLALAAEGTLVYGAGGSASRVRRPVWVTREGVGRPVDPDWEGSMSYPDLSPDGTRLALSLSTGDVEDVWIKQLDAGPGLRLTLHESGGQRPAWTADGTAVTFYAARDGNDDLWTRRADGSAQAELELDVEASINEALWSPDGAWLVYRLSDGDGIYGVNVAEGGEPVPLVDAEGVFAPTLSPDGRYLAFSSNETGRHEVYVVPFPNTSDARWAVSTGGGTGPLWSPVGDEIFFVDAAANMVSVPVGIGQQFTFGTPEVLFPLGSYASGLPHHEYDVSADAERFLMLEAVDPGGETQLVLVQGFFEVLRERVPR